MKGMKKHRIAPELKEQIINRIKNDGISVAQAAKDHGLHETTIYGWIAHKVEGAPSLSEFLRLKKENRQLLELIGEMTLKLSDAQKKN
jgi:transposase-like protein